MKTNPLLIAVMLTALSVASGVSAQTVSAPLPAPATSGPTLATRPFDQVIYAPRLPSAQELTDVATARGVAIERIEQTPTQVTAVYKLANGQTSTVGYVLLPSASTSASSASTVVTTPPPTVIYQQAPRVVYYDPYDPFLYSPWYDGYPSVGLSLGFGFSNYYGRPHYARGYRGFRGFGYRGRR